MIGRLHLKAGVPAGGALQVLRELIAEASTVTSVVGHDAGSAVRETYVRWVENAETQLSHLTHERGVIDMLQTERYWQIRAIHSATMRPVPLVTAERDLQRAALVRLADDLERRVGQLSVAPGDIAVLDTTVLLHYQEPTKVPWREILGSPQTRLIVPLRVVEELDA